MKMKIKLDDKHTLNSDGLCCWITADVIAKNGKHYERRISGYMPTFSQCVESYIERKFRSSEATDIVRLKNELEELKEEVRRWKDADKIT